LIALVGAPLTEIIHKIKMGPKAIPKGIAALLTILSIYFIFFIVLFLFIPPLIKELKFIATVNFPELIGNLIHEFPGLRKLAGPEISDEKLKMLIIEYSQNLINTQNIKLIFDNIFSIGGSFLAGWLAVSFITFFILKDKSMIFSTLLLLIPEDYADEASRILHTTRLMLTKYFTGLFIDVIIVSLLVGILMFVFGVKNAFLIGLFAGIMNVIPYIGPLISLTFALFLGITGCLEYNQVIEIQSVTTKIFFILIIVNLIDGIIFQPYIFSSSVKAHPLEIFIVILMAATLSGVWGMVVAIPIYTFLRIIAKEFFSNSRFFRKLTEKIS
ncbi:MAG: AI-2E family transporter, partial [Bacteroidota bacterium]